jgi:hypothetical protein
MPQPPSSSAAALPRWLVVAGSAVILFHLAAIIIPVLDVRSGPWPTPMGPNMGIPPEFAHASAGLSTLHGKYLRVAHSYHLLCDRPADLAAVEFEVRLRDDQGKLLETLRFPDPQANAWVRHRQTILASPLALDFPAEQQGGEIVAAPGANVPKVEIWLDANQMKRIGKEAGWAPQDLSADPKVQVRLRPVPQHLVPREPGVRRPSEWSMVVAKSYARHLCKVHGAASAEIVRLIRDPVSPAVLFNDQAPPGAFDDRVASFGEMSR